MKSPELCYTTLGEKMTETLIDLTNETIEAFKNTTHFQAVKKAQKAFNDDEVMNLLDAYKGWQDKYQDVKKYGHHHPDFKDVQKAFQSAKIQLYTHPLMVEYLDSYKAFQSLLDQFTKALASTISDQIQIGHIPH